MRKLAMLLMVLLCTKVAAQETSSHPRCPELDCGTSGCTLPDPPLAAGACANGDFETGIDTGQWFGRHGDVSRRGEPRFFVQGISGGLLTSCEAHQSVVTAGLDPIGISQVAPGGSTQAVRIGNAAGNARSDLLGRRFVVEPLHSVIDFSYAVVLQHPMHEPLEQKEPSFEVRVLDAAGREIEGAVRLHGDRGETGKLIAGIDDFQSIPGTGIVYRDWSCGRIDLSAHVGRAVTVEFITEDCTLGGHYGYAYLDNFCTGGDCAPSVAFGEDSSCGPGRICFRYTGERVESARLELLQDGRASAALTNAVVTADSICFPIDEATLDGLPAQRGGFDYVATVIFLTGTGGVIQRQVGSAPDGRLPGPNNDYAISCGTPGCCPGVNFIANGDFEAGNTGFDSDLTVASVPMPSQYAILTAAEAADIASTWIASPVNGRFLAVNGETGRGNGRMVWSQTVNVVPGTSYRFCARVRNFPQPAFDVKPTIELRFGDPLPKVHHVIASAAWQTIDAVLLIPAGVTTITCEIWLADDEPGDGNDLAIDEISLQNCGRASR